MIRVRSDDADKKKKFSHKCVSLLTKEHFLLNVRRAMGNRLVLHRSTVGQTQSWRRSGRVSLFTTRSAHVQI